MICKLCKKPSKLCNSHAIPDNVFKHIFRKNSGKAIEITDTFDKPIRYSKDSWATPQLCEICERKLNETYERYSLDVLKGTYGGFKRLEGSLYFEKLDTIKIRQFIAAIIWRASISKHPSYDAVSLTDKLNETLRFSLNTSRQVPKKAFSLRGFKLVDSVDGGISREDLREFMMTPFKRRCLDSNNKRSESICFIFLGYMFEVYISSCPKDSTYFPDFIGYNKTSYEFKNVEVTKVPEVFELMLHTYGKNKDGITTLV
ncbi:hypothetical protein [Vibrio splendidus]|uniref:hypothetical protein n=1 Tax=Vibrio splendidus TaxID=29497 RepID=UPI000D348E38|nr:hypothetical protein [Vibrio splendidus]PTP74911.1 hypothetical protein CWO00_14360 [Vibrio splendidus]